MHSKLMFEHELLVSNFIHVSADTSRKKIIHDPKLRKTPCSFEPFPMLCHLVSNRIENRPLRIKFLPSTLEIFSLVYYNINLNALDLIKRTDITTFIQPTVILVKPIRKLAGIGNEKKKQNWELNTKTRGNNGCNLMKQHVDFSSLSHTCRCPLPFKSCCLKKKKTLFQNLCHCCVYFGHIKQEHIDKNISLQ